MEEFGFYNEETWSPYDEEGDQEAENDYESHLKAEPRT